MNILVIDGQGGQLGSALIKAIKSSFSDISISAVGTNATATAAMLKAGADSAATGENSVVVCARSADVIIGPVAIVIADALLGEITPAMAKAISQSSARRILIPVNHCDNIIVGVSDLSMGRLVQDVITEIGRIKK